MILTNENYHLVNLATMGEWSKSYVIPSIVLSATAGGFLTYHLLVPTAKVDGYTITLLVVGLLPWLRTIFESIDFPGGGSVKWRRDVEAKQERQSEDIQAMRFLLARFLTEPEREVLQNFADGRPIPFKPEPDGDFHQIDKLVLKISALLQAGLIAKKPERHDTAKRIENGQISDFRELYDITESGRQYLDLLRQLPDINPSNPT